MSKFDSDSSRICGKYWNFATSQISYAISKLVNSAIVGSHSNFAVALQLKFAPVKRTISTYLCLVLWRMLPVLAPGKCWNRCKFSILFLRVTSLLVENYSPLLLSFLPCYQTLLTQLALNDTDFGRCLFTAGCITRRCFLPVLFIWEYYRDIWCSHHSFELGRLVMFRSTFGLSLTWPTLDVPFICVDFSLPRSGKRWTWSSVYNLLYLLEPRDSYCLFILLNEVNISSRFVCFFTTFWLHNEWGPLSEL